MTGDGLPDADHAGERDWRGVGAPSVVACPDGPLLVRGDVELVDADGSPIPRHRRTLALCRCGAGSG